ncbi:MAG: SMP-30/gluconolactonase/LRE family protein [Clostridiaceae bacterium]
MNRNIIIVLLILFIILNVLACSNTEVSRDNASNMLSTATEYENSKIQSTTNQTEANTPQEVELSRIEIFPEITGNLHGIAFDHSSNMFIGKDSKEIIKVTPDGKFSCFAEITSDVLLNMTVGNDDCLYIVAKTKVYKVTDDGKAELLFEEKEFTQEFGGHNIIFDSEGNMYIPYLNTIYKYTPSLQKSVFLDGSKGDITFSLIAGMAFDKEEKKFYVSDPQRNNVVRYNVNSEGNLDSPCVFENIPCSEYIVIDCYDNAYIGDYTGSFITRITKDSSVEKIVLSGSYDCNTIAFGNKGFGSQTLYGTSHAGKLFKIE